jgi:hypothetical protein
MWLPGSALEEPGIEEVARIVAQLGAGWPQTRIIARADSDFAREALMACEANGFECILDLAKNIIGEAARRSKEFVWSTRKSWSRARRVIGKAEWTQGEANPRFVVTLLTATDRV